jgi:large subunit ribosomal protein L9
MARMKVLLTEDVPNVGLAGEVYTLASGFARNYLIPRGEAVPATPGALKRAEDIRKAATQKRAQERENAAAQAQMISQQRLLFQVRAGGNGRLYGSVTNADIAEQLQEKVGFEIDRRRLVQDAGIRDLGIHNVELRLMPDVTATFSVAVVREDETWEDAERRQAKAQAASEQADREQAANERVIREYAARDQATVSEESAESEDADESEVNEEAV